MTYAELKAAILKIKSAVETKNPLAAFAAVGEFVRLAGEFFGQGTRLLAAASGSGEFDDAVSSLKVSCDDADAVPQLAGGLWGGLIFEIIKVVVDRLKK